MEGFKESAENKMKKNHSQNIKNKFVYPFAQTGKVSPVLASGALCQVPVLCG